MLLLCKVRKATADDEIDLLKYNFNLVKIDVFDLCSEIWKEFGFPTANKITCIQIKQ